MNICYRINIVVITLIFFIPWHLHAKDIQNQPFTVVIDPGHGGKDPGAVYKQIREKNIVLNIGLKLGEYIQKNLQGVNVVYTRNSDVFVPLHMRAEIANKNKADLFISIHANYCGTPSITGTETFVLGLHRSQENLDVAKKENAVILLEDDYSNRYEGFDPNLPESYIMFEMVQDDYLEQSINFAAEVQSQFKNRAGRKDRSVKQAGFLVLRRTSMPSVLVEAGFLSNPAEANYINSSEGQSVLASAIFRAVRDYKSGIEAKSEYRLASTVDKTTAVPLPTPSTKKEQSNKEIYFSVQLVASSTKIDPSPDNFHGLQPLFIEPSGSIYKYLYGREYSFEKIQALKKRAQIKFPDAFIVAFENGTLIPVRKALKKIRP